MNLTVSPIRLKYAIAQSANSTPPIAYTYLKVKVQNIDDSNDVEFFYKDSLGNWQTEPLVLEATYGDYNLFGSANAPYTEEFAIKYAVEGIDYWDSYNGINYKFLSPTDNLIGGNVVLNWAIAKTLPSSVTDSDLAQVWIEGEIFVRKISFSKQVGIKFSTDQGESWIETKAIYKGVEIEGAYTSIFNTAIEVWKFKTPSYNCKNCADKFRIVVYYKNEDNGEYYWDNNFEQDYQLSKLNGSIIE